jgi:outer membrane protein
MFNRSLVRFAAAVVVFGAAAASAATAQGLKIGLIDSRRLITESNAGRAVLAGLDKLADDKSQRLKPLQDEVQDLQKKLQDGRLSLSEEKLADMQKQLDDKLTQGRRLREDLQKEMEDAQARAFSDFEQKLAPLIEKFGKEQGLSMIFNVGFFNQQNLPSGIVWADPSVDVTTELIRRIDAALPGESAPAAKPAAKPATPAPPPPSR